MVNVALTCWYGLTGKLTWNHQHTDEYQMGKHLFEVKKQRVEECTADDCSSRHQSAPSRGYNNTVPRHDCIDWYKWALQTEVSYPPLDIDISFPYLCLRPRYRYKSIMFKEEVYLRRSRPNWRLSDSVPLIDHHATDLLLTCCRQPQLLFDQSSKSRHTAGFGEWHQLYACSGEIRDQT